MDLSEQQLLDLIGSPIRYRLMTTSGDIVDEVVVSEPRLSQEIRFAPVKERYAEVYVSMCYQSGREFYRFPTVALEKGYSAGLGGRHG